MSESRIMEKDDAEYGQISRSKQLSLKRWLGIKGAGGSGIDEICGNRIVRAHQLECKYIAKKNAKNSKRGGHMSELAGQCKKN